MKKQKRRRIDSDEDYEDEGISEDDDGKPLIGKVKE